MIKKTILSLTALFFLMTLIANSQIINITNLPHTASVHPWVIGFDNGKAMVVWMEGTHVDKVNPRDIWYSVYSGSSWSTPGAAFPNPGKIAKNPHMELHSDGVIHLVWGEDDPDRDVFHGIYQNGAWKNKTKIYDSPYNSNWMKVGILANGTVNVNWCSAQSGGISQYWRTRNTWKPVGSGWVGRAPYISTNTPYNPVPDGWDLAMHPGIACRGNRTYAVWHEGNHSKMTVKFAQKTDNGAWSNPVNVWPTGSLYYRPDIVVDSNNNVHIICFKGANCRYKGKINGSWTAEREISNGGVTKGFVDIDIDSNDNLHAVYQVGTRIFYNHADSMGNWADEQPVSNGSDDQHSSCDAADDGYVHIVWCTHDEGEDGDIMYTRILNPDWGSITTTSPRADDIYDKDGTIPFVWTTQGITGDVDIKIRNETIKQKYSVATVPYDSSPYNYDIPANVPAGYYRAGVLKGSILGKTGIFAISDIAITSDHTGQNYGAGSFIPITWTAGGMTGNVTVKLIKSDNSTTTTLTSVPYNSSSEFFPIPADTPLGSYYVKIEKGSISDSTGIFNVVAPTLDVTSPTGGSYNTGDTISIGWSTTGIRGYLKLTLWKADNTANYPVIDSISRNASPYVYTVPCPVPTGTYYVKIEHGTIVANSEQFTITYANSADLTVIRPNGEEIERAGTVQTITWTASPSIANVMAEVSYDSGDTWSLLIDSIPNTGSYTNLLPVDTPPGTDYRLRISDVEGCASDESDGDFTILAADPIHIFSPAGGEVFNRGDQIPIGFTTSAAVTGTVKVFLAINYLYYFYIGEYPADALLFYYTIPANATPGSYMIAIKSGARLEKSNRFTIN